MAHSRRRGRRSSSASLSKSRRRSSCQSTAQTNEPSGATTSQVSSEADNEDVEMQYTVTSPKTRNQVELKHASVIISASCAAVIAGALLIFHMSELVYTGTISYHTAGVLGVLLVYGVVLALTIIAAHSDNRYLSVLTAMSHVLLSLGFAAICTTFGMAVYVCEDKHRMDGSCMIPMSVPIQMRKDLSLAYNRAILGLSTLGWFVQCITGIIVAFAMVISG